MRLIGTFPSSARVRRSGSCKTVPDSGASLFGFSVKQLFYEALLCRATEDVLAVRRTALP
jgi:hypothetical protein